MDNQKNTLNIILDTVPERQISIDCPYGNESEDINMQINAIVEDLILIDEIYDVKRLSSTNKKVILVIITNLDPIRLKQRIKTIMSDYFCYFRLDNINKMKEIQK